MSLRWLPNAISLLRIALVIPILLLIINARYGSALALCFVAGFSDGVDRCAAADCVKCGQ